MMERCATQGLPWAASRLAPLVWPLRGQSNQPASIAPPPGNMTQRAMSAWFVCARISRRWLGRQCDAGRSLLGVQGPLYANLYA